VSGGTLSIPASGTVANDAITYVGASAGNSVLIDGGSLSQEVLLIGNANGAVGAVYQTNGTVSAATTTTFDNTSIGNLAGAFGYYDAIGGTFTSDGIAVGGENNSGGGFSGTGGNGIMDINGGVVTDTGWFVMARGATNETGVLNVYSGSLTFAGGGLVCNWGTNQTSVINVLGGSVANASADNNLPLNFNNGLGDVGILNCISGTFQTSWIEGGAGTVNFNGGTLAASKAQAVFLDGLAGAYVYGGGATINNNGYAVTIPQALLAPTGYGVGSISLSSGGQGYIAPPIVTLSGGSGSGATAIAQLNLATGVITNLLVTSAGINYLSSDTLTVTLAGGGGSGAVANPPVLTANTSGGLTATGSGSLTLTAGCTYTGNTVITNGTLLLGAGGSIADSAHINVTSGSTFDVSAANFTLATGQTLMGNGTVNGSVTNSGTVAPGTAGVIGALTFNNNLTLKAGGITSVKLNNSLATSNDLVTVSGALTYGGTLSVQNLGSALVLGNSYTLFSAGSATGSFASISGSPGAGLAYSFNAASGVLSVVTGVASNPTNLLYTVSGNALAIAWPTDHLGWILQAQTNSLPAGLGTNWVDVAGSANGTSASITIDATAPAVFYRLRHP
jgi:autotransporter-associated beta strand protein